MKFTPSPTKIVCFIDKKGKVIKEVPMNRAERRKLKIRGKGRKGNKITL